MWICVHLWLQLCLSSISRVSRFRVWLKVGARIADLPVRRNVLRSSAFVGLEALDDSYAAAGEDARGPEEWFAIVTHSQSHPTVPLVNFAL